MTSSGSGVGDSDARDEGESRRAEAADLAHRRLRTGLLSAVFAVIALSVGTPLAFWDVLGIPLLLLVLPALAVAQLPLLKDQEIERMPVYLGSMVTILVLGLVGMGLGLRTAGVTGMHLLWPGGTVFLTWTGGLTLVGLGIIGVSLALDTDRGAPGSTLLTRLYPRTTQERWTFGALSLSAGFGEEVAYRGYALVALQLLPMGPWLAATISSLAFGVLHAYQGPVGVLRTAAVGFLFAAGVLLSGSLLPAIAAHALIDLIAGLGIGPFLIRREAERSPLDPATPLG